MSEETENQQLTPMDLEGVSGGVTDATDDGHTATCPHCGTTTRFKFGLTRIRQNHERVRCPNCLTMFHP